MNSQYFCCCCLFSRSFLCCSLRFSVIWHWPIYRNQKSCLKYRIQKDDSIIVLDLGIFIAMLLTEVTQKWLYCPLNPTTITKCGSCYRAIMVNLLYSTSGLIPLHRILFITYCLPCVYLHSNLCLIRKVLPFSSKAFNWSEGDQQVVCIKFH